jgi:ABC-2 type transport system ATP-binding protein
MTGKENAIETHKLTKRFGDFTAVNQVDFYIPKGEVFGLLGPNGAGKTTAIRMLCGIMKPTSGGASVLGFDIERQSEQLKQRIGYMSQKFSLYNDLTPGENISFYASIYGVPRSQQGQRVDELIEMAGLSGQRQTLTRELSGAWRQRLALACAIAHKPPMLFLDEATAGVDPLSRRDFWDLIYEMAGEGTSILATTHYMDEAEYCNTIGMMYRGEMIALASPDTLRDRFPGRLILVECDQPSEADGILRETPGVLETSLHGVQVHATVGENVRIQELNARLSHGGVEPQRIEEIQPSLEDVFINLVNQNRARAVEKQNTV